MQTTWKMMQIKEMSGSPVAGDLSLPAPGPGQVLVRLHAAALNFADLLMTEGRYQETPPLPFVPGLEGAGEVLAAGPGVALAPGTRVAVQQQGTMAQANLFSAQACYPIPDAMPYEQAAGFLIAYGTSHFALTLRGGLRAGETLAVLGAAGGVGLTAVEIGAALGARVIAVARGADKLAIARAAGATECLDSETCTDLRAALRELGGVDVVYDPVGDAPGAAAFGALRPGGRFLVIGFAGGKPPALPLNHALVKNIAIHGFYWGGYRKLDPALLRQDIAALFALYDQGRLRPHVGATLPLQRLAQGYDLLRTRRATGKVIVSL
ncbi:NADPH:quinone reductase [Paracoccus thiocyanatus]|uniref:NADPH:quinone reductase n=1 Tax=Paracoccus thiocyanatus TaxID=34006 RepID=A0A1N6Y772_9RHOB|nr:NADPH:quinone oxidoreductase family protein [Paracoccus thiocyanatus]SIR10472.1 NADPH:quinone reductase [Paracoccus thiocyanatus]